LMYKDGDIGCWSVIGNRKSVTGITREDLVGYREKYLDGEKMVVVVAGAVENVGQTEEWIRKYFAAISRKNVIFPKVPVIEGEERAETQDKGLDQAHFALGFPTVSWRDERLWAARLWDIMMAGNTSSRLWQEIREKRGLAYYVFSVSEELREAGYIAVQVGVKKNKLKETIDLVKNEFVKFADLVTEDELERAKKYIRGKTKLMMDRSDFWAGFMGKRLLLRGEIVTVKEELKKYEQVSLKQIKMLVREKVRKDQFRLAVRK